MNPFEFSMMQAVSGMRTNSQRITISAENVSNADTPGYQRKILTSRMMLSSSTHRTVRLVRARASGAGFNGRAR